MSAFVGCYRILTERHGESGLTLRRVGDGTDVLPVPVVGKPYIAIVESVTPGQSLAGEPLRQVTRGFQTRDRFGRTRSETQNGGWTIDGQMVPTKIVIVSDPVSHCQFHWTQFTTDDAVSTEMNTAFVTCGPQTLRYKDLDLFGSLMNTPADGTSTQGDTTTQREHLVPLQIDGVTVNRLRISNSRRDEQGQVKKWSGETWYSLDLKEIIRLGDEESGYEGLTNIRRIDPDPRLFYPPEGYRIEQQPAR